MLQPLTGNFKDVIVQNCKNVIVKQGTFHDVSYIDHIRFVNIKRLALEPNSLQFTRRLPTLKVNLIFYNVSHFQKPILSVTVLCVVITTFFRTFFIHVYFWFGRRCFYRNRCFFCKRFFANIFSQTSFHKRFFNAISFNCCL